MINTHNLENLHDYNETSLKTLSRAITLSQADFSLILVRCNDASWREQIAQRLVSVCPFKLRQLVLSEDALTLYTTIQAEICSEQLTGLMVFGLESVRDLDRLIISSNHVREDFRLSLAFPLILWVNDQVLKKFIWLAPDLENWATVIEFVGPCTS